MGLSLSDEGIVRELQRSRIDADTPTGRPQMSPGRASSTALVAAVRALPFARSVVESGVLRTPAVRSLLLEELTGASRVFLKCEQLQPTGSFKIRGALAKTSELADKGPLARVAVVSSGNHALAVSYAAARFGFEADAYVPQDLPTVKLAELRRLGATIEFYERQERDSVIASLMRSGIPVIPAYDDPTVVAGQATATAELHEQVGIPLELIISPVGGGGLAAGAIAACSAASSDCRVIGVEPATANDTQRSLRAGKRVRISDPSSVADGLLVAEPGVVTLAIMEGHLERVVTVTEAEILGGVLFAHERLKLVVEPSASVVLAALLSRRVEVDGLNVGVLLSGGNLDISVLKAAESRREQASLG